MEPQQHEAMLAIRGLPEGVRPTIGELAERLQIQHHSAVELADRLEKHGLIRRFRGEEDHREVLLRLAPSGERVLSELSHSHGRHLRDEGLGLLRTLRKVIEWRGSSGVSMEFSCGKDAQARAAEAKETPLFDLMPD